MFVLVCVMQMVDVLILLTGNLIINNSYLQVAALAPLALLLLLEARCDHLVGAHLN